MFKWDVVFRLIVGGFLEVLVDLTCLLVLCMWVRFFKWERFINCVCFLNGFFF